MSKEVRRVHPRVSYEQRIRLLGEDGKPAIVGRTLNLSPSGIYVRAPNGCEVGSEVMCDLPLPGGTRQLRGRVTRTQSLSDDSTGIGIQFVDLNTADSSSLHRALEGSGPRPVAVKVVFEGMAKPIKCHGVVTAEGLRLSTSLPFLRLGSDVQAIYDGKESKIDARGVLTGVRLEPVGGDGVPRLGVDVDIDSEMPLEPSAPTPVPSREDMAVGGAFTTWDKPPVTTRPEPPVVTDFDAVEVTAIVPAVSAWRALLGRLESLRAWGFVVVAALTFSIVYIAINHLGPGMTAGRRAREFVAAGGPGAHPSEQKSAGTADRLGPPLVVPSSVAARAAAATAQAAPPPSVDDGRAKAGSGAVPVKAHVRSAAKRRPPGTPFDFDEETGNYQLRPGASIDMKGAPLIGLGGLGASAEGGNLRGINAQVESGALFLVISLPRPEVDSRFAVQVTPSWPTPLAIVGKSTTGFTVSFGTPAPADAHLDWFLIR